MSSTYCTETQIKFVFGSGNVDKWLDLDNDGSPDTGRLAAAIDYASDTIDDFIRGTHYVIPLATAAAAVPGTVIDAASKLAGVWLYESRGINDFSPDDVRPLHRLSAVRESVFKYLEEVRAGIRKLDAR